VKAPKRLAYLGPAGTHTEQACLAYDPEATLLPFASIEAVAGAVESNVANEGVVPIENSLGGSVNSTLDLLIHESTLFIRYELVLPIKHFLLGIDGASARDIKAIYSHPQALDQCRGYLSEHFPKADVIASLSTAAAVEDMLRRGAEAAAIGTERARALYGVAILAGGIEDSPSNMTRFVTLAPTDHPPTGADKTSVCFSFDEDAAGVLHSVLGEFAERRINLTKIESRPTRQSLGRYIFLVDLEGHRQDAVVQEALRRVETQVSMFKVFGSYPRYINPQ
jgi:prephenate dehydratase